MTTQLASGTCITPELEAAWLEARRHSIGASEAADALGIGPGRGPLWLWSLKTGRIESEPPTEEMKWGKRLENQVLDEWEQRHGVELRRQVYFPHRAYSCAATLDGLSTAAIQAIEAKTVGPHSRVQLGDENSDSVPDRWIIQVHIQMACLRAHFGRGEDTAFVPVLIQGQRYREFTIAYDQRILDAILPRLKAFWMLIETDEAPEPSQPNDADYTRLLHLDAQGETVLDEEAAAAVDQWEHAKAEEKRQKEAAKRLRAQIEHRLGAFQRGLLPDGRILRRTIVDQKETNVARKAYSYGRLSVINPKGGTNGDCDEPIVETV